MMLKLAYYSISNPNPKYGTMEHGTPAEKWSTKEQQKKEHWRNSGTFRNNGTPAE